MLNWHGWTRITKCQPHWWYHSNDSMRHTEKVQKYLLETL